MLQVIVFSHEVINFYLNCLLIPCVSSLIVSFTTCKLLKKSKNYEIPYGQESYYEKGADEKHKKCFSRLLILPLDELFSLFYKIREDIQKVQ